MKHFAPTDAVIDVDDVVFVVADAGQQAIYFQLIVKQQLAQVENHCLLHYLHLLNALHIDFVKFGFVVYDHCSYHRSSFVDSVRYCYFPPIKDGINDD